MKIVKWSKYDDKFVVIVEGAADPGEIVSAVSQKGTITKGVLVERVASLWEFRRSDGKD